MSKIVIFFFFSTIALFLFFIFLNPNQVLIRPLVYRIFPTPTQIPTPTPPIATNTPSPTLTPVSTLQNVIESQGEGDTFPWGIAQQLDEHTWTMKIELDPNMSTPQELLEALNNYRQVHGSATLEWNQTLADYAQSRAQFFTDQKGLDSHAGFQDFLDNQDGFTKLGFRGLGENASYGYRLSGVHLIEWIYAGDQPHNQNQLNPDWHYVGIGIKETASCLIFASDRI